MEQLDLFDWADIQLQPDKHWPVCTGFILQDNWWDAEYIYSTYKCYCGKEIKRITMYRGDYE